MDGDYTFADLDYLGLSECTYDDDLWICNIDTVFKDLEDEDYYQEWYQYWFPAIESWTIDSDYTLADSDYLDLAYDYHQDMESWSPVIDRENLSKMTITMDGDYSLAYMDHLGLSDCMFDDGWWICNIDTALDLFREDHYQLWSSKMGSWSPDIERENLSHDNGIISSVSSNLQYSRFTQDFGKERSRSLSPEHDRKKISRRYQENHPGSIQNSNFPLFPEPLATVSLLFLICISFPLFCWFCYWCFFRNGAANSQRRELSKVLLSSFDVVNARNDNMPSIVII